MNTPDKLPDAGAMSAARLRLLTLLALADLVVILLTGCMPRG